MDRNPDYQFISTDTSALISSLIAAYEYITGTTVLPASPGMLFIRWIADVLVLERAQMNKAANQNVPSRAVGENLDALADLTRAPARPEAQPAVCTQRFYITAPQSTSVLVPAGTRVTGGGVVWETSTDEYIPIGELFVDCSIRCQIAGIAGNGYAIGQITALIDINNIPYFDRCENITVSDLGADRATDDEYYEVMRASMDAYSTAGAKGGYEYYAKSVSLEIADVVVNSLAPGHSNIFVLMKDGTIAGEEIKNSVYAACSPDYVRPQGDFVAVGDAETVGYDIDFTYYIPKNLQISSSEVEQAAEAAVYGYIAWQCGKLGRDINMDELRQRVKATGIKRIVMNCPEFIPLRDGKDDTIPQVAAVGSITIVNGGYEDE